MCVIKSKSIVLEIQLQKMLLRIVGAERQLGGISLGNMSRIFNISNVFAIQLQKMLSGIIGAETKMGRILFENMSRFFNIPIVFAMQLQKMRAGIFGEETKMGRCPLYTSPSPREQRGSRMPPSA